MYSVFSSSHRKSYLYKRLVHEGQCPGADEWLLLGGQSHYCGDGYVKFGLDDDAAVAWMYRLGMEGENRGYE